MKFAIIGGGISGLTTALAFEKVGIDYEVFEAAPELNEVGAGIWMASNAMQVFGWLDIAEEIQKQGMSLQHVEVADQCFQTISSTNQQMIVDALGYAIVSIHRGRLQKILYDLVPKRKIHLGRALESTEQDSNGVTARFLDGGSVRISALIGADGIHSVVRKQLFPNARLRYSGQTCWRGVAQIKLSEQLSTSCIETWGNQIRFGISSIGESEVYWFAVAKANFGEKDNVNKVKDRLKEMFKDFAGPVAQILEHTPPDKIIRSDLSDLKPMKNWHKDKILLIGDAGHATTPNMGQGGAQGVEDAYYLAHALKNQPNLGSAYDWFEKIRKKKVNKIVKGSNAIGQLAHIKYGQSLRNFFMRSIPESITNRQMIELYSITKF